MSCLSDRIGTGSPSYRVHEHWTAQSPTRGSHQYPSWHGSLAYLCRSHATDGKMIREELWRGLQRSTGIRSTEGDAGSDVCHPGLRES
jgi:hypothetical protein